MDLIIECLYLFTSDKYLFPIVQASYIILVIYSVYQDIKAKVAHKNSASVFNASVKRGSESMAKFHATYVALAFLIVLVTLNIKSVENHRVFFVLLNIGLLAYLCFWNAWFRNKLIGLIIKVSKIEKR